MAVAVIAAERSVKSRWTVVGCWLAGLFIYAALIWATDAHAARWINDIAWTVTSAAASIICLLTGRALKGSEGRPWWLLGIGCASWFLGQLCWNYNDLALGVTMPYLSIGQALYAVLPLLIISALTQLPEVKQDAPVMLKQLGNVGLVTCCLLMTVVLGLIEPAIQSGVPLDFILVGAFQNVAIAGTFLYSLYLLWTYRWSDCWSSLLILVVATGIYAVSNLIYIHALLTHTYLSSDLINVSWMVVFGLFAWAAKERTWAAAHAGSSVAESMLSRERWVEAVIPALLIIIMVIVAVSSSNTLTTRVLSWAAAIFIAFAVILGVREALIQSDAQRLNEELLQANRRLNETNTELRDSEHRYRDLNTALENRVAERTAQLERAYGELEGFSYAVAHDLKAPLRAINGFAHLLSEELGDALDERSAAHLGRIRSGSMKMSALIDDLLAYAHIERRDLHASELNLQSLIPMVLAEFEDDIQRWRVRLDVEIEPLTLFVDSDGLVLALRNLIENALKYSREMDGPAVSIKVSKSSEGIVISIRDNGIGFDMQYHDRIFKVFERLHRDDQYPGTGIGLALVSKAVERMGGRVWAESQPRQGATFYIELPAA